MTTPPYPVLQLLACPLAQGVRDLPRLELWLQISIPVIGGLGLTIEGASDQAVVLSCRHSDVSKALVTLAGDDTYTVSHVHVAHDLVDVKTTQRGIYAGDVGQVVFEMLNS